MIIAGMVQYIISFFCHSYLLLCLRVLVLDKGCKQMKQRRHMVAQRWIADECSAIAKVDGINCLPLCWIVQFRCRVERQLHVVNQIHMLGVRFDSCIVCWLYLVYSHVISIVPLVSMLQFIPHELYSLHVAVILAWYQQLPRGT